MLEHYKDFAQECQKYFPIEYCHGSGTPHLIHPKTCKKIFKTFGGYNKFVLWFAKQSCPSEFILHSLAMQYFGKPLQEGLPSNFNTCILNVSPLKYYKQIFSDVQKNDSCKVLTLHTEVILDKKFADFKAELYRIFQL